MLSYQWTCPGGSCDAGAVDPEWAARIQQNNILVVNVRNGSDNGAYTCTVVAVGEGPQPVATESYSLTVTRELCALAWTIKGEPDTQSIWTVLNAWFPFRITAAPCAGTAKRTLTCVGCPIIQHIQYRLHVFVTAFLTVSG